MREKMLRITAMVEGKKADMKKRFLKSKKPGNDLIAILIVMLIVVIIGAALLAIMRTAMPSLFNDIMDKIQSVFTI